MYGLGAIAILFGNSLDDCIWYDLLSIHRKHGTSMTMRCPRKSSHQFLVMSLQRF